MTEIKSEIKEEPMFSFKNFFKASSKNVQAWALTIKGLSITGMASSFAIGNPYIFYAFMVLGGIAEAFILFTREKPSATLAIAIQDVKEDIKEEGHVE